MDHSFKDLISGSHPKIKINFEDWKEHLGMLFPDVRINNIIEIRSIDAINPEYVLAVPALLQALIYDETAFGKLESILMDLPENEFPWYQQVAARDGLAGQVNQVNFSKFCKNLVASAQPSDKFKFSSAISTRFLQNLLKLTWFTWPASPSRAATC